MGFGRKNSSSDENSSGLKEELGAFVDKASVYARVRGELFAIEVREAAEVYWRKLGLTVIGAFLLVIGYLLILTGVIGIFALLLSGAPFSLANWMGASFLLALIHLAIGTVLIKNGKKCGQDTPVFEYTRNEFKKDQQWMREEKKP